MAAAPATANTMALVLSWCTRSSIWDWVGAGRAARGRVVSAEGVSAAWAVNVTSRVNSRRIDRIMVKFG